MKRYIYTIAMACLLCLEACTPSFEENPTDPGVQLPWTGDVDKFSFDASEGIRLDDTSGKGGEACICFLSAAVRNARWEVDVRFGFNPSQNNFARFYLAASSEQLDDALHSYYVEMGGEGGDAVSLWRQEDGKPTQMIQGREWMKGDNSPAFSVRVECDNNGQWRLWTRAEGETDYTEEGSAYGNDWTDAAYAGLYCKYTQSRSNAFTFSNLRLTGGVENAPQTGEGGSDDEPDIPQTPAVPDFPEEARGMLLFNEVMFDPAEGDAEYIEIYNPLDRELQTPYLLLCKMRDTGEIFETTVLRHPEANKPVVFPSHSYLCFIASAQAVLTTHDANAQALVEVEDFPQLNNNGGYLALMTPGETPRTIDTCSFLPEMHDTDGESAKGVALEKRSPLLPSNRNGNWRSSRHSSGGTPGRANN